MVQDVYSKADVLNTSGSCGAPNFRQVKGAYPLYGMGQPSLNGFKQVLQWLQAQGHEVSHTFFHLHLLTDGTELTLAVQTPSFAHFGSCLLPLGLPSFQPSSQ